MRLQALKVRLGWKDVHHSSHEAMVEQVLTRIESRFQSYHNNEEEDNDEEDDDDDWKKKAEEALLSAGEFNTMDSYSERPQRYIYKELAALAVAPTPRSLRVMKM
jgi:hypothetical protein